MPERVTHLLQLILTGLIPVLLLLISVRLMLTESYLKWQYQRLPDDPYGWTCDVRMDYGSYGIRYLFNDEDIDYLRNLKIGDDTLFNERELRHMEDVKQVVRAAILTLYLGAFIFVVASAALLYRPETRISFIYALIYGGLFTIALSIGLALLAIVAWDFFFDGFHAIFFEGDSWLFNHSDSLIRLYPQDFWFQSALIAGGLTLGGSALLVFVPYLYLRIHKFRRSATSS